MPKGQDPKRPELETVKEIESLEEVESLEDIEELDEIGELEPLEEAEPVEMGPEETETQDASSDSASERDAWVASVQENFPSSKKIFSTCVFPVLMITPEFKITFANNACKHLFRTMPKIEGSQFINVFGNCFKIEDIKSIREVILKGTNSFSWKGKAHIKSREQY